MRILYLFCFVIFTLGSNLLIAQNKSPNNILKGKVLYLSSGNKPAAGVHVKEKDSNGDYSKDNGEYVLIFQTKRNGDVLAIEVGTDNLEGKKIELVNEKEIKVAKLPSDVEEPLDIIVCFAGQRDFAAQKYYHILRTAADRELEKRKKEVDGLMAQKEKNYQQINDLSAKLVKMQQALDSAKIREHAYYIASINLDRASQLVKDAVKRIDEGNDVEGALKILNTKSLDTAYQHASEVKKKADAAIMQVIEGYEFRISLLVLHYKYGEIIECYEQIVNIYERENYDKYILSRKLNSLAFHYGLMGNYQKALELNLKALRIREQILSANHSDLIQSYNAVSFSYNDLGEYQKGLEFNLKALAMLETAKIIDSIAIVNLYISVAWTYGNLGDNQKELEFLLKSLSIAERVYVHDHLELGVLYNHLSVAYGNLSDYPKQLEFGLKSLAIIEKRLPVDHPDLADAYNNMFLYYFNTGQIQKAKEALQKSLTIAEKIFSADHPKLAWLYNSLGVVYNVLEENQNALDLYFKALNIAKKTLPSNHPELSRYYDNIGLIYNELGEYEKGLEYQLKALEGFKEALPKDHPDIALCCCNIAVTYGNMFEYKKKLMYSKKALSIRENTLTTDHRDLAASYSNVSRAYIDLKKYQKAIQYSQRAINIAETSNLENTYLNLFYANLATAYMKKHKYPEARAALEKSQKLKDEAGVYGCWAVYYSLQKEKKEAVESLQKAISLGFKDLIWLETESGLKNIRKEREYLELVEKLKKID